MATPVRRIVDTSSLILLAKVGQLELLRAGVPEIIVPSESAGPSAWSSWQSKSVPYPRPDPWLNSCDKWVFFSVMTWPVKPWRWSENNAACAACGPPAPATSAATVAAVSGTRPLPARLSAYRSPG